jgi:poly-gamma-glutamate synthesis protein (capsule biosynthesis protein)
MLLGLAGLATMSLGSQKLGPQAAYGILGMVFSVIATQVIAAKHCGDIVIASIHWGGNWGYAIPAEQRYFAPTLIDQAGVDLVHGHSSRHPRGIVVYRNKLILYGCGDFLNDYEGVSSHEEFRGDLTLMYLPELDPGGQLLGMGIWPMQAYRFRLRQASPDDSRWLARVLDRESRKLGSCVVLEDDRLRLYSVWMGIGWTPHCSPIL